MARYVNDNTSTSTIITIEEKIAEDGVFYTNKQNPPGDTDGDTRFIIIDNQLASQKYDIDTWVTHATLTGSLHTGQFIADQSGVRGFFLKDDEDDYLMSASRIGFSDHTTVFGDHRHVSAMLGSITQLGVVSDLEVEEIINSDDTGSVTITPNGSGYYELAFTFTPTQTMATDHFKVQIDKDAYYWFKIEKPNSANRLVYESGNFADFNHTPTMYGIPYVYATMNGAYTPHDVGEEIYLITGEEYRWTVIFDRSITMKMDITNTTPYLYFKGHLTLPAITMTPNSGVVDIKVSDGANDRIEVNATDIKLISPNGRSLEVNDLEVRLPGTASLKLGPANLTYGGVITLYDNSNYSSLIGYHSTSPFGGSGMTAMTAGAGRDLVLATGSIYNLSELGGSHIDKLVITEYGSLLFKSNSVDRLTIDTTDTKLISPDGNKNLSVDNTGVKVNDGSGDRLIINDNATYIYDESSTTPGYISLDSKSFKYSDGAGYRIDADISATKLNAPNHNEMISVSDTQIILSAPRTDISDSTRTRLSLNSTESQMTSPDGNHNITVDNTGVHFTGTLNNDDDRIVSPDTLKNLTITDTDLKYNDGTRDRLDINGTDTKIISQTGEAKLTLAGTLFTINDGTRVRVMSSDDAVQLLSPDGSKWTYLSNSGYVYKDGTYDRLEINSTSNIMRNASGGIGLTINGSNSTMYSPAGTYHATVNDSEVILNDGTRDRVLVDVSGTTIYSPDGTDYVSVQDSAINLRIDSSNRLELNTTYSAVRSPDSTKDIQITNSGLTYDDGTRDRIVVDATNTDIMSPNGVYGLRVTNAGIQYTTDSGTNWDSHLS